jgi:hypothetical protein
MTIDVINRVMSKFEIKPHAAACYSFIQNGITQRQTAWLVPHVIRHKDDSEIITWRCNWGHVCEADCFYALYKEKINELCT